jgi:hypothetical protein
MILVNGCSFSQGQHSWPCHLKRFKQPQVVNLSCSSAGNTYIHESTINALSRSTAYQAVLIMWSGLTRIDARVSDIDRFQNSCYNSKYASEHNDWPKKIIESVDDQDFVDKDWVFGLGEQNRDKVVTQSGVFTGLYKHMELKQFVFHFLIKLISLQNTLKIMNLPYCFMFYQPYQTELQNFPELCKLIDWNCVYLEQNIFELAKLNNDFDSTGHPGITTHKQWASIVDQNIIDKLLGEQYA